MRKDSAIKHTFVDYELLTANINEKEQTVLSAIESSSRQNIIEYEDIQPHLKGFARSFWYYSYMYEGLITPFQTEQN